MAANAAIRKSTGIEELFGGSRRRESPADLCETRDRFEAHIAAPGFRGKDIRVVALPEAIVVRAEESHLEESTKGGVLKTQFGERRLFRRIELPGPIDVNTVTAKLKWGTITVLAGKAGRT